MKIHNFEIMSKSLFWRKEKTIIFGDFHLGYEETLREQGWHIPKSQAKQTLQDLEEIFNKTGKCREIILLGDIKHYFSGILKGEWKDFYDLIKILKQNLLKNGKITIIRGNHDTILEPLIYQPEKELQRKGSVKREVTLNNYYIKNSILFIHGNYNGLKNIPQIKKKNKISLIIMGHYHPAIILTDKFGIKQEKYKCFLYGKSRELHTEVVVLPSFFPLVEGTDIRSHNSMLEGWINAKNFKVFALDDEGKAYNFGKVKNIR